MTSRFCHNTLSSLVLLLVISASVLGFSRSANAQFGGPDSAFTRGGLQDDEYHADLTLIAAADVVAPGETLDVGVLFEFKPEWHIYWRNSGDSGLPTEVTFGGDGLEFGALQWPAPEVFGGSLVTFGYSDHVVLFAEAQVPDTAEPGDVIELTASAFYLVCDPGTCIIENSALTLPIRVGDISEPNAAAALALTEARERLPRSDSRWSVETEIGPAPAGEENEFELSLTLTCASGDCPALSAPADPLEAFVPEVTSGLSLRTVSARVTDQGLAIGIRGDQTDGDYPMTVVGVVLTSTASGPMAIEVSFPMPLWSQESGTLDPDQTDGLDPDGLGSAQPVDTLPAGDGAAELCGIVPGGEPEKSLVWILVLALFGGMILNVMPCVFPVLSIKVFAFVDLAHEERGKVVNHSLMYTLGILAAMWGLAAAIIGLKAAGTSVSWGFQFQSPIFLTVITGFLVLFAANLFGVFEVSLSAANLGKATDASSGYRRSFMEGLLAVALATPCAAPLLGTATGFALAREAPVVLGVFTAIGLGLAAPFVLLTLIPGWAKVLPRPGDWMTRFRQFLGLALIGTSIWLLTLIGETTGVDGMTKALIFAGVVGLGAWVFGASQGKAGAARWGRIMVATAVIVAAGVLTFKFEFVEQAVPEDGPIDWARWTPDAVTDALDNGQVVFVDFTASYCLTCKLNKANVVETETVVTAFHDYNVASFIGDYSVPNEAIRGMLERYQRGGVPLNLVYSPSQPNEPLVLPELLSTEEVICGLKWASSGT